MVDYLLEVRGLASRGRESRRARWAIAVAPLAAAALALACVPSQAAPSTRAVPLYSFGENLYGELGDGTSFGTSGPNATPLPVYLPDLETITTNHASSSPPEVAQVAVGAFHSLVLTTTGKLYAFGLNNFGQLANGDGNGLTTGEASLTLIPGFGNGPVVSIAAGAYHSLAVTSTGQLYAFGENQDGQLGQAANTTANPTPTLVRFPRLVGRPNEQPHITAVAAGDDDSFAVTSAGELYAFGDNSNGQLGTPTGFGSSDPTPTRIILPAPVAAVAAGADYTFAVTSTGQLYAFGHNQFGQLGIPTATQQTATPTLVTLQAEKGVVTQVAAGRGQTLVATSSGQLYAFGYNWYGQLGNATNIGTTNANPGPALVTLPAANGLVVQVSATDNSSFAVTSTGQLFAFGFNDFGQLGLAANSGTAGPNPDPATVLLPGGERVETVARGSYATHTLVVVSDLAVTTAALGAGRAGTPYGQTVTASGGSAPYTFSASALPAGLSISTAGKISGTPTKAGTAKVVLTVTDANGIAVSSAPLALAITTSTTTTTTTTTTSTSSTTAGTASIAKVKIEAPTAVVLTASCAGAASVRCTGTLSLIALEHLTGHTITAITAAKPKATRTVTLGRTTYRLAGGARGKLTIKLNAAAQSLLASHHRFRAELALTATGSSAPSATRTITLSARSTSHRPRAVA